MAHFWPDTPLPMNSQFLALCESVHNNKNWLFIGGGHTGWRSAVVYTIVEQIRCHGQDPFAYFEWVFGKLMHDPAPEELPDLLPAAWLKAQGAPATAGEAAVA